MAIEIPIVDVSLKEEGLIHLFRADATKFGRGFADGSRTSVPHEVPYTEGVLGMAKHTIDKQREHFPWVDEIMGKDYELGVVVGVWVSMKQLEMATEENPQLKEHFDQRGGIPS